MVRIKLRDLPLAQTWRVGLMDWLLREAHQLTRPGGGSILKHLQDPSFASPLLQSKSHFVA